MSTQKGKASETVGRAVANLLRLASSDIKDAELLSAGRNPDNAPLLLHIAFRRMVEAVLATEQSWPVPTKATDLGKVPDENPLKLALARFSKMAATPEAVSLLQDGSIPKTFDADAFRQDGAGLRKLLQELAEKFGVDLLGDASARNAVPVRPPPAPAPEPGRTTLQYRPKLESSTEPKPKSHPSPKTPAEGKIERSPIVIPDSRSQRHNIEAPRKMEGRSPIEAPRSRASVTSAAFWGLMDRWAIPDLPALRLIGHSGGLSKKGTRPRFKLAGEEAEMVKLLFEIDQAISNLGLDPRAWVNKPIKLTPFEGGTPLSYLSRNRLQGTQQVSRYILKNGLKLSMGGSV